MKSFFLAALSLLLLSSGQKMTTVVIQGKVDTPLIQELHVYKYGINCQLSNMELDTVIKITPSNDLNFSLRISDERMYGIQDGIWGMFTHDLFLRPGDTITILFRSSLHYKAQLKSSHAIFTRHIMTVKSKYPGNITFFDDIADKKLLRYGHLKDETLPEYKARCESEYHIWTNLLNKYIRSGKVSGDFVLYARAELYAMYIAWLADPCTSIPRAYFPKNYFSGVDALIFNNTQYMLSHKCYGSSALLYNSYIADKFDVNKRYGNLKNKFNFILENHSGI